MDSESMWVTGGDPDLSSRGKIGCGGSANVHAIYHIPTGQFFARKVIFQSGPFITAEDIENEERAILKLCTDQSHPNIVTVLRTGTIVGFPYYFIDMELCDMNLEKYINPDGSNHGSLPYFYRHGSSSVKASQIWNVMSQIASGVVYIHGHKEVHRDLKPRNVLYSRKDGVWKIADFGLTTEGTSTNLNETVYARGTSAYRAPELINQRVFNSYVDIWSLGCILYELATGYRAFTDDIAVLEHSQLGKPVKVKLEGFDEETSKTIHDDILRMLQLDPSKRPSALSIYEDYCYRFEIRTESAKYALIHHKFSAKSIPNQQSSDSEEMKDRSETITIHSETSAKPRTTNKVTVKSEMTSESETTVMAESASESSLISDFRHNSPRIYRKTFEKKPVNPRAELYWYEANASCTRVFTTIIGKTRFLFQIWDAYNGDIVHEVSYDKPSTLKDYQISCPKFSDAGNYIVLKEPMKRSLFLINVGDMTSKTISHLAMKRDPMSFAHSEQSNRVAIVNYNELSTEPVLRPQQKFEGRRYHLDVVSSNQSGDDEIILCYVADGRFLYALLPEQESIYFWDIQSRTRTQCKIPSNLPSDSLERDVFDEYGIYQYGVFICIYDNDRLKIILFNHDSGGTAKEIEITNVENLIENWAASILFKRQKGLWLFDVNEEQEQELGQVEDKDLFSSADLTPQAAFWPQLPQGHRQITVLDTDWTFRIFNTASL